MRAPTSTGFRNFSGRYRSRYGQDPVRTATLVYDAVALVAALTKTQGQRRFSEEVLTNTSGFTGIDGLFRFRARRHQPARARGDAGVADRRADHQPGAASFTGSGTVSAQVIASKLQPGPRASSIAATRRAVTAISLRAASGWAFERALTLIRRTAFAIRSNATSNSIDDLLRR